MGNFIFGNSVDMLWILLIGFLFMRLRIVLFLLWVYTGRFELRVSAERPSIKRKPRGDSYSGDTDSYLGGDQPLQPLYWKEDVCHIKVQGKFSWAKYVFLFGVILLAWMLVLFVWFCLPVRPNIKITIAFGGFFLTIVWTIVGFTAQKLMYRAFFRAFKSSICSAEELHNSLSK